MQLTPLIAKVGAIVKTLLFKSDNKFILCLVSGDKKCSLNKLKKINNKKDICMASPDEVKAQTGYTIGGVSPVGHLNSIEILIDKSLERFNNLYAAAGHPNCVFKIDFKSLQPNYQWRSSGYIRMRQPKLIDYLLLTFLALIWASAFFNIKIATYHMDL